MSNARKPRRPWLAKVHPVKALPQSPKSGSARRRRKRIERRSAWPEAGR